MKKSLRYSFITCTLGYLLASLLAFVLFSTLFHGSYESVVDTRGLLGFLTLGLSDFSWWDNFYYLALLVPWISSSLMLTMFLYRIGGGQARRLIFPGISISAYYFAMWLVFIVHGLITGWGDMAYNLLWLWPVLGFCAGITASAIVEKVF